MEALTMSSMDRSLRYTACYI